jgi:hypothetical protein
MESRDWRMVVLGQPWQKVRETLISTNKSDVVVHLYNTSYTKAKLEGFQSKSGPGQKFKILSAEKSTCLASRRT